MIRQQKQPQPAECEYEKSNVWFPKYIFGIGWIENSVKVYRKHGYHILMNSSMMRITHMLLDLPYG